MYLPPPITMGSVENGAIPAGAGKTALSPPRQADNCSPPGIYVIRPCFVSASLGIETYIQDFCLLGLKFSYDIA
jgi:hypothetical protein